MVNASCVSEVERRIGWACARLLRHRWRIIGVAGRGFNEFSAPPENVVIQAGGRDRGAIKNLATVAGPRARRR